MGTRRGKLWKLSPSGSADIAWDKTELPLPSKAGFQSAALDCLVCKGGVVCRASSVGGSGTVAFYLPLVEEV